MVSIEVVKKLEGLQTIESVQKKLNIARSTAIKYVHLLRKQGFVETTGGRSQPRFYKISALEPINLGNPGMIEIMNEYSPIKIRGTKTRIIGRGLTLEEALIRAIESGEFRIILASLALFNHIRNWPLLYRLAKEKNLRRKVGALYDIARKTIKTRRMDRRVYDALLNAKEKKDYIIKGLRSDDYRGLEERWGVFIPFDEADLWRYKEWQLQ